MSGEYNINILQGSDKHIVLTLKNDDGSVINLTGYTANMQVRPRINSKNILDELTTTNNRIDIEADDGRIILKFPNGVSTNYDFENAVYDVEVYAGGRARRLIQGRLLVDKEVTR